MLFDRSSWDLILCHTYWNSFNYLQLRRAGGWLSHSENLICFFFSLNPKPGRSVRILLLSTPWWLVFWCTTLSLWPLFGGLVYSRGLEGFANTWFWRKAHAEYGIQPKAKDRELVIFMALKISFMTIIKLKYLCSWGTSVSWGVAYPLAVSHLQSTVITKLFILNMKIRMKSFWMRMFCALGQAD